MKDFLAGMKNFFEHFSDLVGAATECENLFWSDYWAEAKMWGVLVVIQFLQCWNDGSDVRQEREENTNTRACREGFQSLPLFTDDTMLVADSAE